LVARDNRISEIPEELGQLENLSILNLQGNRLQELPRSLLKTKLASKNAKVLISGNELKAEKAFKKGGIVKMLQESS
jgi:Leucine-rich repeat (LRR) protein